MKKYIIGAFFGFLLTFTVTAYAADIKSMIGKTVDSVYRLTIDGKQASQKAIVVEGVSYISTQMVADLFGYDVNFNETSGVVLNKKTTTKEQQLEKIQDSIHSLSLDIWSLKVSLDRAKDGFPVEEWQTQLDKKQREYTALKQQKAALEATP